jgi:UDPglucose--hexose-1-phosphate uridylyltransferase
LPIIAPHTVHSLRGARDYFKKYGRCVRCDIIKIERKKKVRIIAENENAIAFVPYASKKPFEITVVSKEHEVSFRSAPPETVKDVAILLQSVMQKVKKYLKDPDLNFFVHDAPLDNKDYSYHHWHVELVPKTSVDAGFELSTGIEINIVDPDVAAAILRGKKI